MIAIAVGLSFQIVTILAPMKRGLKAIGDCHGEVEAESYNPCPDEKGTESADLVTTDPGVVVVTILAPMKRGLKVWSANDLYIVDNSLQSLPR